MGRNQKVMDVSTDATDKPIRDANKGCSRTGVGRIQSASDEESYVLASTR